MPITLHSLLPPDGAALDWVHLVPAGQFRGVDGRGPYRLDDAQAVIHASMAGGKIPIDENHAIDLAAPQGGASPARGWITGMDARADGIWGHVEWTPTGAALMAERAYRGLSPALLHDAGGRVTRVLRAALVNVPNLPLHTLHHQETGMDLITQLRQALGLPDTADEAAVLTAARGAATTASTHAAQIAAIATAAGVQAADSNGLVTALQAQRTSATAADQLGREVVALQSQLNALSNERARERAVAFLDAQIAAGKPVSPTLREHYITRHMADAASVEKELGAMVSLHAGGLGGRSVLENVELHAADGLTPEERRVAEKMNLDPKKFAEQKKKVA